MNPKILIGAALLIATTAIGRAAEPHSSGMEVIQQRLDGALRGPRGRQGDRD